ncbi:MAG: diadenylate cyclase CdaA [Candidatus Eisenbacteria bacterium]|uniref:Diadenylate cyclase n=1 Tax=Eiseniibacteriota bacterium TaxID=2212470 RepID=A0A956NCX4_UNCEI|nr:diadenylate cyclase CdaA [Candidatus Eisenbacteria bacterium]MCB9465179.1 TIGR00159 family protein [Candidatus Eisenbacteria bacterium]
MKFTGGWIVNLVIDFVIVTFLIYHLFLLVRGTRALQMFLGLMAIILLSLLADVFHLSMVQWLLASLRTVWVVAFLIIFQPELRRGLSMMGNSKLFKRVFKLQEASHLGEIEDAVQNLRKRGLGAIVVMERNSQLRGYIETGTLLESNLTAELIETVFTPPSPLHDGAIIVRGNQIVAAGCILPLSTSTTLDRSYGTRHRAILGISEETDALAIAVSEETRQISIAENGRLIRNVDPNELKGVLAQFLTPADDRAEKAEAEAERAEKNTTRLDRKEKAPRAPERKEKAERADSDDATIGSSSGDETPPRPASATSPS